MSDEAFFSEARRSFHAALFASVLRTDNKLSTRCWPRPEVRHERYRRDKQGRIFMNFPAPAFISLKMLAAALEILSDTIAALETRLVALPAEVEVKVGA